MIQHNGQRKLKWRVVTDLCTMYVQIESAVRKWKWRFVTAYIRPTLIRPTCVCTAMYVQIAWAVTLSK
jgi:hypothetical protein